MAKKGQNIYKRKDGRWEGRVKNPLNGKYQSVYGKSYGEVREKMTELVKKSDFQPKKCNLTVKELFELWLCRQCYKIKASSYANYIMKLRLHIYPALGNLRFELLTSKIVSDFIAAKLQKGRLGGGTLSASYVGDIVMLLKCMGKFAEREYGYDNPIRNVEPPRRSRAEAIIPPKSEQALLREYLTANLSERNLGILLCLFTGVRIGELCALKWGNIDFSERCLRVCKTAQRIKKFDGGQATEVVITEPKSAKSNREIPLPKSLFKLLMKHKKEANTYILSGTERLVEPRTMQYYLKSVLKKVNLPYFNFHVLRHTFATNCLQSGFDVKTLSEILGHSSVELTLNRYVHSSKERKRECMELLRFVS